MYSHHNASGGSIFHHGLFYIDINDQDTLQNHITYFSRDHNPWTLYLEMLPPDMEGTALQAYSINAHLLVFFKYYDPVNKCLTYAGSRIVMHEDKLVDLVSELNKMIGTPEDTALDFYRFKTKAEPNISIGSFVKNGDILIFERNEKLPNLELPTYLDYFNDLQYRVDVTFIDKNIQNDNGFTIELSVNSTYDQVAKVKHALNMNPWHTKQFFKFFQKIVKYVMTKSKFLIFFN